MNKYLLVFLCILTVGCNYETPSDAQQRASQEALSQQSNAQVGMPGIANFTEKKIVRKLYELRDSSIATFTYMPDFQGRLWHVCDSIGYGLPYGVQFSNPEKLGYSQAGTPMKFPQSEPNGLFMPPTAEGSWIICASEKHKGDFEPMYVEPRVIVSPFRLNSVGDYQIAQPGR